MATLSYLQHLQVNLLPFQFGSVPAFRFFSIRSAFVFTQWTLQRCVKKICFERKLLLPERLCIGGRRCKARQASKFKQLTQNWFL